MTQFLLQYTTLNKGREEKMLQIKKDLKETNANQL